MNATHTLYERNKIRIAEAKEQGKYREEITLTTPQGSEVDVNGSAMLNFCSNDYLGLAQHPEVVAGANEALHSRGAGLASVRFICGTQDIHRQLEAEISEFLGYEEAILVNSCFDANVGVFQALLNKNDVILSDELNHASIIDGTRLSSAAVSRYRHADMQDLEQKLQEAADAEVRLIVTDGVFSMDGAIAPLPEICDLAEKYGAMVLVDDSHGTGVIGETGRGTPEYWGVADRIEMMTGTFGKALGGAAGGFVAGSAMLIDLLKQSVRPYLFSNALPPAVVGAGRAALGLLQREPERLRSLYENTVYFRSRIRELGFNIQPGTHPIVPVMLGDENETMRIAAELRAQGLLVIGFTFPVVAHGTGRIRVQISAHHTKEQLDRALEVFSSARSHRVNEE